MDSHTDSLSSADDIHVAVQGGGARVAYALGAIEVLRGADGPRVRSFSCASSGAFAALAFIAQEPEVLTERLFSALSGRRFMNRLRLLRMVDFDYLIDEVLAPILDLERLSDRSTPPIWVTVVDAASAMLRYKQMTEQNAIELLRATNAFPVLYGKSVRLDDGRDYLDGGIGDPFPVIHALSLAGPDSTVVPVATKPVRMLEEPPVLKLQERAAIAIDRRISRAVRHQLLSPNPLVEATVRYARRGAIGSIRIATCEPSIPDLSFSRTAVELSHLHELRSLGSKDMQALMDALPAHSA